MSLTSKKFEISDEDLSMLRKVVEETRKENERRYVRVRHEDTRDEFFSEDGSRERYFQRYFEWVKLPENRGKTISEYGSERFAQIVGEDSPKNPAEEQGGLFTRDEIDRMLKEE